MGLVQVGTNFNVSSPSSLTVTMSSAPTSGNTVVAFIEDSFGNGSPLPVVSIASTNTTWTFDAALTNGVFQRTEVWHGVVSGVGGTSVLITLTNPVSQVAAVLSEWSGLLSPTTFDGETFNSGITVAATTGSYTTTGATDLVIASMYNAASSNTSPGAPWTTLGQANVFKNSYIFGAAAGLQPTASWSTISVHQWMTAVAGYRITAPAVGAPLSNIVLLGVGRN